MAKRSLMSFPLTQDGRFERIVLDRDQLNAEIEGIVANDDDLNTLQEKITTGHKSIGLQWVA